MDIGFSSGAALATVVGVLIEVPVMLLLVYIVTARHAFQAFRHPLNAVQYAEIAVMDNENLDDDADRI